MMELRCLLYVHVGGKIVRGEHVEYVKGVRAECKVDPDSFSYYDLIEVVDQCFHTSTFAESYNYIIKPIPDQTMWVHTDFDPISPPPLRKKSGRPKKSRRKGHDEPKNPSRGVRKHYTTLKCGLCKQPGHNARTCSKKSTNASGEQREEEKEEEEDQEVLTVVLLWLEEEEEEEQEVLTLGYKEEEAVQGLSLGWNFSTRLGNAMFVTQPSKSSATSCGSGSGIGSATMQGTTTLNQYLQGATSTPSTQKSTT
ncbi:hypothetical protein Vadar_016759 [Vaccinium darrowii]|uniref:Uncharacterized protein n=1 Tax=Vaccinium darrowii TaxID=229202 RepID=A0ACB7ZBN4_9ERIC|nr:hypothetical protein Vadar_016759 [Vaccinium darrowii]